MPFAGRNDIVAEITREEVANLFKKLNRWRRGDEVAPHKPLLLLWALASCLRGENRLTEYSALEPDLNSLLEKFAPKRKQKRPRSEEPFRRLRNNGMWEIVPQSGGPITRRELPKITELRNRKIQGGFTKPVFNLFRRDKLFAVECINLLLHNYFPESLHFAILSSIGNPELQVLELTGHDNVEFIRSFVYRRPRDRQFRLDVLNAWKHRCAVCRMGIKYSGIYPALEAAHIMWHCYKGPDTVSNGLALCSVHHRLFDFGAFTIKSDSLEVVSASEVTGSGSDYWLADYDGKKLDCNKIPNKNRPSDKYLAWHGKNVFKNPCVLEL